MMKFFFMALVIIGLAGLWMLATGPAAAAPARQGTKDRGPIRPSDYSEVIRVACVGDSITFGHGVENRESNCYPAVLARSLGPKFQTRNFGVNGSTALKKGDKPYWQTAEFQQVAAYAPQVVVIKLGTNDTKPHNWQHAQDFPADYGALLEHFRSLPSRPRLWVCLPVPIHENSFGISQATLQQMIPLIRQVAAAKKVPVIDTHSGMNNRAEYFPDGVHPNHVGAAFLAQIISYELVDHDH